MSSQFINGQWLTGNGRHFVSENPVSKAMIWEGCTANAIQVDAAVNSAQASAQIWRSFSLDQRIEIMQRFACIAKKNIDTMAELIAQETGKILWEAKTEAQAIANKVTISIQAHKERACTIKKTTGAITSVIRYKPHGAVAIFGPYNFPAHLPNGHIIPALLAGNTIIFKPSELTPATAEMMIKWWEEAGIPNGVINLVQGDKNTGQALAQHPRIKGIFFTGSAQTGKLIHRECAGNPGKILALELGGNNPLIVTKVDNMRAALHDTIQSAFITAGQRCTCARRIFIPKGDWGNQFLEALIEATNKIRVGLWNDNPQPFTGALISEVAARHILQAQDKLICLGGVSLLPAKTIDNYSALLHPGIIETSSLTIHDDEEYFGPLLQVKRYTTLQGAIDEANHTRYGLSASLLSDCEENYTLFYQQIHAGIVNWNRPTTGAASQAPFGGIGDSGNHRPSAYFAVDYCTYPVAGIESVSLSMPDKLTPGLFL